MSAHGCMGMDFVQNCTTTQSFLTWPRQPVSIWFNETVPGPYPRCVSTFLRRSSIPGQDLVSSREGWLVCFEISGPNACASLVVLVFSTRVTVECDITNRDEKSKPRNVASPPLNDTTRGKESWVLNASVAERWSIHWIYTHEFTVDAQFTMGQQSV